MTQRSGPFSKPGATGYKSLSEDRWAKTMRYVLGTGVLAVSFQDELNELLVSASTGKNIVIDSGAAWIQGHLYENDAPALALTLAANTTLAYRIDLIVLELKWGPSGGITAKIIPGTVNDTVPIPDQRYGVIWQLPLAQVKVAQNYSAIITADITDRRNFVNSGSSKSATFVVASDSASPLMRANVDAVVPYGSRDAQNVINDAIGIVHDDYGGGSVLLSEGVFNTKDSITLESSVTLSGTGFGTVIQQDTGAASGHPMISAADSYSIVIKDLTMAGAHVEGNADVGGMHGIFLHDCYDSIVKGVYVTSMRCQGIALSSTTAFDSNANHITQNRVYSNAGNGIDIQGARTQVSNNIVSMNGGTSTSEDQGNGIRATQMTQCGIMANIVNMNWRTGIVLRNDVGPIDRSRVSENQVFDNSYVGSENSDAIMCLGNDMGVNRISILNNLVWCYDAAAGVNQHYSGVAIKNVYCEDCTVAFNDLMYACSNTAHRIIDFGTRTAKHYNIPSDTSSP